MNLLIAGPVDATSLQENRYARLSPASVTLKSALDDVFVELERPLHIQELWEARKKLAAIATDCAEANWDGYDAVPVRGEALKEALDLLGELPPSFPIPDIAPTPTGDILFEWFLAKDHSFTLSVSGGRVLTYAGIFGRAVSRHGTERLSYGLPPAILQDLRRLFAFGD